MHVHVHSNLHSTMDDALDPVETSLKHTLEIKPSSELLVVSWLWFQCHRSPVLCGLGNKELLFGPAISVALVLMAWMK